MRFNGVLQRANLKSLQTFIKYGCENFEEISEKTYSQRIDEATKKSAAFFQAHYDNTDELDKITGYFNEQVSVFEEVYFEIGLILGFKIAFQIHDKIDELI